MSEPVQRTVPLSGIALVPVYLRFFLRAALALLKRENRAYRRQKGLTFGDAFFNFVRLSFLERALLRYRRPVQFGKQVVLDSVFPPWPSPALDKRLANYVNHLDLTELPTGMVSLSTTNSCPYACAFCSTAARRSFADDLDEELLKNVITRIEKLGTPSLILHGGEPMYRYERFLGLVRHVSSETCLWMFTTGYGVTAERARELKAGGLFGVWVSLDHYDKDRHNRLRGHPAAFDNAVEAVTHFRQAGVYTCLSLVPPDEFQEQAEFTRYYDFAKDLGVAEIRIMEKKPSGREACRGVTPHSEALAELHRRVYADPAFRNHPPLSGLSTWLERDPALGCQCRFEYLFITATGEVQPCEVSGISFGNVGDESFESIYRRACEAFTRPSTGCIPMVLHDRIQEYQGVAEGLSGPEKAARAGNIMREFRQRGTIPGAYRPMWHSYKTRVAAYRSRRTPRNTVR